VAPPFLIDDMTLLYKDERIKGIGQFAGKDFFNIFSYDLIKGDQNSVLSDKHSIVLSVGMALKLFNTTENIVGKELEWESFDMKVPVLVSGVYENLSSASSDQFDFLLLTSD